MDKLYIAGTGRSTCNATCITWVGSIKDTGTRNTTCISWVGSITGTDIRNAICIRLVASIKGTDEWAFNMY